MNETPESDYVPIKVRRIKSITEKAILIRLDNGEEHWLPLSQVATPETPFKQNQRNLTIKVKEWLIEEKRLGMSQNIPSDIVLIIKAVRDWDKFALAILADRIRDSDGSWLEDCLKMLIELPPVHQEIKTIGEFLNWVKDDVTTADYKRIFHACRFVTQSFGRTDELFIMPMEQLVSHKKEEFLLCPDFGARSLEKLRLHLYQHGFLLEGDTRSAVEEMEEEMWGVEDDNY